MPSELPDPLMMAGCAARFERLSRLLEEKRKAAIGLRGNVIAQYDLPPAHGVRWTALRKADLIAAILGGVITLDEAKARYALTTEELSEWRRALAAGGVSGLKATKRAPRRKEVAPASEEPYRNP
jgi:hypothetical protein